MSAATQDKTEVARILLVDDDPLVAESLAELLSEEGHEARTAYDAGEALAALEQAEADEAAAPIDVVITDESMPRMSGTELLLEIQEAHPGTAVIMLTGYGTIEGAVDAMRMGACDYLTKPLVDDELRVALARAMRQRAVSKENEHLKRQLDVKYGLGSLIGKDPRMVRVYEMIEAVAPSKATVLMSGESGVGKSLVARSIHNLSPRRGGPYVEISCGSIPETLLESELFGHVKGAFTGAHADKIGRFQAADGGTLFLDEINSASPGMQLKLLRALQERRFEPVGSMETREVDVRVILASNQPLERLVAEGAFRQDLYYRINVVQIGLPPLRERVSDIPSLAQHFLHEQEEELGREFEGFTSDATDALRRYAWPGNVRELANIVERAAVLARGSNIGVADLPAELTGGESERGMLASRVAGPSAAVDEGPWVPMPLVEAMKTPERRILIKALEANGWNRSRTADQLDINRTTLYKKMKQFGIEEAAGDGSGSAT